MRGAVLLVGRCSVLKWSFAPDFIHEGDRMIYLTQKKNSPKSCSLTNARIYLHQTQVDVLSLQL